MAGTFLAGAFLAGALATTFLAGAFFAGTFFLDDVAMILVPRLFSNRVAAGYRATAHRAWTPQTTFTTPIKMSSSSRRTVGVPAPQATDVAKVSSEIIETNG